MHYSLERSGVRWWSEVFTDGELYFKPTFGLSWCGNDDGEGWLHIGFIVIDLHLKTGQPKFVRDIPIEKRQNGIEYGFNFVRRSGIHIHWGPDSGVTGEENHTIIDWPSQWWHHYHTDQIAPKVETPYRYWLSDGTLQERKATFYAERRESRWHLFDVKEWRTPLRRVGKSIWVEFDGEVGDETGSWKGGTMGCGYTMLPGERPMDTLRRMERERAL